MVCVVDHQPLVQRLYRIGEPPAGLAQFGRYRIARGDVPYDRQVADGRAGTAVDAGDDRLGIEQFSRPPAQLQFDPLPVEFSRAREPLGPLALELGAVGA